MTTTIDGGASAWRDVLGVWHPAHTPRDKQALLAEAAYRSLARKANGNEAKLRMLNAAIIAAREELGE